MKRIVITIAVAALVLACSQTGPEVSAAAASPAVSFIEKKDITLDLDGKCWIDFQTGSISTGKGEGMTVDAGLSPGGAGFIFCSPMGKQARTRFFTLSGIDREVYDGINSRNALLAFPVGSSELEYVLKDALASPFYSSPFSSPAYIAFKTYTPEEGNSFGIICVRFVSERTVTIDYKLAMEGGEPRYSGACRVEVLGGKLWVDGRIFPVKGAAATIFHTRVAAFGGNTVRIYAGSTTSVSIMDRIHEVGLKCYFGLKVPQYVTDPELFEDGERRREKLGEIRSTVRKFRNHPALLCWCLGNELEVGGNGLKESIWSFFGELFEVVREEDPAHPITLAITNDFSAAKLNFIKKYCPKLDFLSINAYGKTLFSMDANLREKGWTAPFMITEFGQPGTWQRSDLSGRINDWGALVQLSSEEAAKWYGDAYMQIEGYEGCLGSVVFWWGYQTHGEVLGWYPMFTRDGYALPAVDVMDAVWTGKTYESRAPLIVSWASSLRLDGKTLSEEMNPVLSPATSHTASVQASSRSGKQLRYKWFVYRDNTYDTSGGLMSAKITENAESLQDGSLNEDAGTMLFEDRTLPNVRFTAPSESGNYRLAVYVYDDSVLRASLGCINFKVL